MILICTAALFCTACSGCSFIGDFIQSLRSGYSVYFRNSDITMQRGDVIKIDYDDIMFVDLDEGVEFILGNGLDGKKNLQEHGYFITDKCRGCRMCYSKCPQKCIDMSSIPFVIKQENCLHCGNCMSVCPFGAVEKR